MIKNEGKSQELDKTNGEDGTTQTESVIELSTAKNLGEKTKSKSETFTGFAVPTGVVKPAKSSRISEPVQRKEEAKTETKDQEDVGQPLKTATVKTQSEETFKQPSNKQEKTKNTTRNDLKVIMNNSDNLVYRYGITMFFFKLLFRLLKKRSVTPRRLSGRMQIILTSLIGYLQKVRKT